MAALEGHAPSWPDATERVPPVGTFFQYSSIPHVTLLFVLALRAVDLSASD